MGFNVAWCIFLLLIGTGICSVYMLLSWRRGERLVQLWWQRRFSAWMLNTSLFPRGKVASSEPPERVLLSDRESLLSEHSSGSVVIFHTFIPKVVADPLFGFHLNLFLSPTTLFLLSVVTVSSSGKSLQM